VSVLDQSLQSQAVKPVVYFITCPARCTRVTSRYNYSHYTLGTISSACQTSETQYYVKSQAIRFLDASLAHSAKSKSNLLFPPRYSSNCTKRLNSSQRSKWLANGTERQGIEIRAPCYFSCMEVKLQDASLGAHFLKCRCYDHIYIWRTHHGNHPYMYHMCDWLWKTVEVKYYILYI